MNLLNINKSFNITHFKYATSITKKSFGTKNEPYKTHKIFHSYILGGRYWPQTRWASVLLLLNSIPLDYTTNIPFTTTVIKDFLNYRLSDKEVSILRKVMDSEHAKAGIKMRLIEDSSLKCEFIKTQIGVKRVIDAFKNNDLPEYFYEKEELNIDQFWFELSNYAVQLSLMEQYKLKEIVNLCEKLIHEHKGLGYLFKITYYPQLLLEAELKSEAYKYYTHLYSLDIKKEDFYFRPYYLRSQISNHMINLMMHNVTSKFNYTKPFFIYDGKLRTR